MRREASWRTENERQWRMHVAASRSHRDSMAAYCRENGISREALRYWQRKLGDEKAASEAEERGASLVSQTRSARAFLPVTVLSAQTERAMAAALPDPKWVAEVLMHLSMMRGAR